MTVTTASGSKVSIGQTTAATIAAACTALTYVPVGEVQILGEFGDQPNDATFTSTSAWPSAHSA